ncbi:MAG: protein kinase [Verrucomicrobia bacterium]|nr:protein kinase [Verrucomicrobiota bacterium]
MEKPTPGAGAKAVRAAARRVHIEVPEHRLLGRIGGGSYGEVLLASSLMGTFRAIKVVFRRSFEDEAPYRREFDGIRRFEPISRTHESLVDVLQVGQDPSGQYFYYIMELADDLERGSNIDPDCYRPRTLRAELDLRKRLPVAECVRIGISLCEGLGQLHEHGLVHRDVKPSNIVFAHGVPKLADIGLVGGLGEARSFVGTPGFVPPEGPGSKEADIYSLGKLLYEAGVGKDRQSFPEIPPELLDAQDTDSILELNEVIVKACHANPADRYHSAGAMAEDLALVQRGKSVRRLRLLERRLKFVTRGGAIAVGAAAVLGVTVWGILRDHQLQAQINQRQIGGLVADGTHALARGDLIGALPYFADGLRLDAGDKVRTMTDRLRIGLTLAQCPRLVQSWSLGKEISDVEFSTDGRSLVIADWQGTARVYDVSSGKPWFPEISPLWYLETASLSPDGRQLLTASEDQSAALWDVKTGELVRRFTAHERTYGGAFSPDGRLIALASTNNLIRVYERESGLERLVLRGHSERVEHVAFNHEGTILVSASNDQTARLWDLRTGTEIGQPLAHKSWVKDASFSPDDRQIVTACFDHTARVWDVKTGREIGPPLEHHDLVFTASFSPDGQTILTASLDGTARLWDAATHQPLPLNPVFLHSGRVRHACFSPEGNRIAVAGVDGWVAIWDVAASAIRPRTIPGTLSGNGERYVVCSNGWAEVFDTAAQAPVSPRMQVAAAGVRLDASGHFLVASSTNRQGMLFRVWAVDSGRPISPAISASDSSAVAILNNTGTTLAKYAGTMVEVFETRSGARLFPPLDRRQPVTAVAFNPTLHSLVTVVGDSVLLWSLPGGTSQCAPLHHICGVTHAEFSPDGRYLLTSCADSQLTECYAQVWDAATGAPVGPRFRHHDGVTSASFSPDGRRVITVGEDRFAGVWRIGQGSPLVPPFEHKAQAQDGVFSRSGRWLATGCHDGEVCIWESDTGLPLGPPFWNGEPIVRVRFIAHDRGVVAVGSSGHAWYWELPPTTLSVTDLLALSALLNPNLALSLNHDLSQTSRQEIWKRHRSEHPELFSVSAQQLALWHEQQARQCEADNAWPGALVHLNRLADLRPGDPKVAQWRQEAARKFAGKEVR